MTRATRFAYVCIADVAASGGRAQVVSRAKAAERAAKPTLDAAEHGGHCAAQSAMHTPDACQSRHVNSTLATASAGAGIHSYRGVREAARRLVGGISLLIRGRGVDARNRFPAFAEEPYFGSCGDWYQTPVTCGWRSRGWQAIEAAARPA